MKSKSKTKKVKKDTKKEKEIKKSTTKKIEKVKKSITKKNKKVEDETKIKKKIENDKKKVEQDKKKVEQDKKEEEKKIDERKQNEERLNNEEDKVENKSIKKVKSIDLLDKYGYDIYNDDEKRQESLGNLVIVYGVVDLIKKLDSESTNDPNMITRFNNDKKWIKNNFKKK